MATKAVRSGGGTRNGVTTHPRKSARRQRALDRLPRAAAMPEPVRVHTERRPSKVRGKGDKTIAKVVVNSDHERDLAHDAERVAKRNASLAVERAALESRIGKPPRSWPKKEKVIAASPVPHGDEGEIGSITPWSAT